MFVVVTQIRWCIQRPGVCESVKAPDAMEFQRDPQQFEQQLAPSDHGGKQTVLILDLTDINDPESLKKIAKQVQDMKNIKVRC